MNGRVTNSLVAVFATTALMFGVAACGEDKKDESTPTPSAEKSSAAPVKPASPSPEAPVSETPVNPQTPTTTVTCEPAEVNPGWALPEWKGNACKFTIDSLNLMIDGALEGGLNTGMQIDVTTLGPDSGSVSCGVSPVSGSDYIRVAWCYEDGYMVVVDKSMTDSVNDGYIIPTFGAILSAYGDYLLDYNGLAPGMENNACASGIVLKALNDKGVLSTDEATVIRDEYFSEYSDTFTTGYNGGDC